MSEQRLQKFLAGAGVASRRKAEELIVAGRVAVNERKVTELGTKVDPARDLVTVDGKLVSEPEERRYYLLYKPAGCVTTASDPQGRPTALEYLRGVPGRVFSVGRLDFDAEGALLLTDDGELANRLAHPRYGHRRVYLVKVKGDPPAEALERMRSGVRLEDGPAQALDVGVHEHAEKNVWLRIVVGEGRFHLVKRLCEAVGLQVARLFRPEFAGITVERLRPGQFRPLSAAEVRGVRQLVGLEPGTPPRAPGDFLALPKAARRHGHGPPEPRGGPGPRTPPPSRDPEAEPARGGAAWPRREAPQRTGAPGAGGRDAAAGPRTPSPREDARGRGKGRDAGGRERLEHASGERGARDRGGAERTGGPRDAGGRGSGRGGARSGGRDAGGSGGGERTGGAREAGGRGGGYGGARSGGRDAGGRGGGERTGGARDAGGRGGGRGGARSGGRDAGGRGGGERTGGARDAGGRGSGRGGARSGGGRGAGGRGAGRGGGRGSR